MTTSDWITLGAAILTGGGTLFLGIMAWRTIRQAISIQKAEKRERLLNEIMEWAAEAANVCFGHEMTTVPREEEIREQMVSLSNKIFRYQAIDTRSPYVSKSAQMFGKEFHTAVLAVISCRNDVRLNIDKRLHNFEDEACKEALNTSEHELRKRALKLIELVAKIKAKDIS